MKNLSLYIVLILLCASANIEAQKYFVSFTDKNDNPYSISRPEEFLNDKAILRRTKHNIAITEEDLPVTPSYVQTIEDKDVTIYHESKWLNGVIIETNNESTLNEIRSLSYVEDVTLIWKNSLSKNIQKETYVSKFSSELNNSEEDYGLAWNQTKMVNGQYVHEEFNGENIDIAILDAGFYQVNTLPSFQHLQANNQILETYDFVNPGGDVYQEHEHGMKVLSIIGGYIDGEYIGSATKANFFLYRTEDVSSEFPIEEYNWVCAAEKADAEGVDIINSSLGYFTFDDTSMDYTYEDMDGQSTIIAKGAATAFSKGMIIVSSAGNEGNNNWKYITSPADVENVLSVGALDSNWNLAYFSSQGPTYDGRIKPDVVAMGLNTAIQGTSGQIVTGSGTSYSAPVISGFTACALQALPELSNIEVLELIKKNGHLNSDPDTLMGYGVPNYSKILDIDSSVESTFTSEQFSAQNNPFKNNISFINNGNSNSNVEITIYNIAGVIVAKELFEPSTELIINNLQHLNKGIYIADIHSNNQRQTLKLTKQ